MQIKPTHLSTLDQFVKHQPQAESQNLKANRLSGARHFRHTAPLPPVVQPDLGTRVETSRLAIQPVANVNDAVGASASGALLTPTDPTPPTPQPQSYNIDDLITAWGKADEVYDFDGNGTVGTADLLHFINHYLRLTSDDPAEQTNAPGEVAVADDPAKPSPETISDAELPVVADAGDVVATDLEPTPSEEPPVIIAGDILTRLGLTADSPKSKLGGLNGAAARAALGIADAPGKSGSHSMGGLRSLTEALYTHLTSSGFANQPPTNIRELIDTLNLSPKQSDFMLKGMAEKYPDGLGVDVVA